MPDITGFGNSFTADYGTSTAPLTITTGVTAPLDLNQASTMATNIVGDYNGGGEIFTSQVEGGISRFTVRPGIREGSFTKEQMGTGIVVRGSAMIQGLAAQEGKNALRVDGTDGKDTVVLSGQFRDYVPNNPIRISAGKGGDTVVLNGVTISQKEAPRAAGADYVPPAHKQEPLLELDLGETGDLIIKGGHVKFKFVDLDGDGKSAPKSITVE